MKAKITDAEIAEFVMKEILGGSTKIDSSTALFSQGMLSSLDLVSLLDFLERTYNLSVPPEDVDLENFDSVSAIVNYLSRRHE